MKSVHLELDDETYAQLERRAKRLGVDTDTAARMALCEHLEERGPEGSVSVRETLEQLRQITSRLPETDVMEIIREAREEIEERDRRRWG
jgi:hypothetical protein